MCNQCEYGIGCLARSDPVSFLGILLMVYSLLRAMHGLRTFPGDDDNDYEHATSGHGPGVTTMVEPGRDGLCLLDPKDKEAAAILPAATAAA